MLSTTRARRARSGKVAWSPGRLVASLARQQFPPPPSKPQCYHTRGWAPRSAARSRAAPTRTRGTSLHGSARAAAEGRPARTRGPRRTPGLSGSSARLGRARRRCTGSAPCPASRGRNVRIIWLPSSNPYVKMRSCPACRRSGMISSGICGRICSIGESSPPWTVPSHSRAIDPFWEMPGAGREGSGSLTHGIESAGRSGCGGAEALPPAPHPRPSIARDEPASPMRSDTGWLRHLVARRTTAP